MNLASVKYDSSKSSQEIVAMRGINYSDNYQVGDMSITTGLSTRRYPYITTRHSRSQYGVYANATALTSWDKLILVNGTTLYYDGTAIGTVTTGAKQFAVVNTKLVIFPDKKYVDMTNRTLHDLGATYSGSGATFTTNTMTVNWTITNLKAGDGVTVSGTTSNNTSFVIKSISGGVITATTDNCFTAETCSTTVTIKREIPDMDYICESENRLWGCSNDTQTIYASALGDPTNFNVFEGISTDSYAVAVGSQGSFTACCKYASTALFFKENKLHKMLGSIPSDFTLYTYDIEGVQSGSHKSLQVINQVLYYKGVHGVFAYSGGVPTNISTKFGEKQFKDGVGGNDGKNYFLSLKEGTTGYLFTYDTTYGIWVNEEQSYCDDFANVDTTTYMISGGKVYVKDTGLDDSNVLWTAQFKPFYETIAGKKCPTRLLMRVEIPKNSYMIMSISQDGKPFKEVGRFNGKNENVLSIRLPISRCDKYELKLNGKGSMTILDIAREFIVGSEVR